MMGSPTHEASTHGSNNCHNNLTNIRGIGTTRKQWFKSLGIYTIADLAHASADDIESQLKSNGRSLSRSELEEWIAQAQAQLADLSLQPSESLYQNEETVNIRETTSLSVVTPEVTSEVVPEVTPEVKSEVTPEVKSEVASEVTSEVKPEVALEAEAQDSGTDWNSTASFKVDYQTRYIEGKLEHRTVVHHLETGAMESQPNFEIPLIQKWMCDRIGGTESQSKIEIPEQPKITSEITQLQIVQAHETEAAMIADKHNPIFSRAIEADEPFALEVLMQFTGLTDAPLQEQIAYQVQCVAYDLSTGLTTTLAEVAANIPVSDDTVYKAVLPELMLPNSGIYRLKVLVILQNALETSSYFKVPMLQVV
jgi:hypothetical protein